MMGLIPGMPHFAFLLLGGGLIQLGRTMKKRAEERKNSAALVDVAPAAVAPVENTEASWDDVTMIDPLGLEVGYRLIPLVDKNSRRRTAQAHQEHPQEVRAGNRLPAAGHPYPRQPRTAAERLSHRAQGRRSGRRRSVSGSMARDQSGPGVRRAAGHADARPGVRPAGRSGSTRTCANRRRCMATRWSMRARSSRRI